MALQTRGADIDLNWAQFNVRGIAKGKKISKNFFEDRGREATIHFLLIAARREKMQNDFLAHHAR